MNDLARLKELAGIRETEDKPLTPEQYDLAARLIQQNGGGFATKLMAAYFHADLQNKRIIEQGFDHLFRQYLDKFNKNND